VVLKAALLNRAMADVRRIIRMRDDKQAMATLVQKGSLGDETVARFGMAEKELEAEILDVVSEANTFRDGWGQLIFPTAGEMVAHLKHKEVYYGVAAQREDEGEWPSVQARAGGWLEVPAAEMCPDGGRALEACLDGGHSITARCMCGRSLHLPGLFFCLLLTLALSSAVKKLTEAGKPVPKPSITLPALVTPPGTQIQVQMPPQQQQQQQGPGGADGQQRVMQGPPLPPALLQAAAQAAAARGQPLTPEILQALAQGHAQQMQREQQQREQQQQQQSQQGTPSKKATIEEAEVRPVSSLCGDLKVRAASRRNEKARSSFAALRVICVALRAPLTLPPLLLARSTRNEHLVLPVSVRAWPSTGPSAFSLPF
jgi:translocation protein SEC66